MLPTNSSQSDIPGTKSEMARKRSTSSTISHNSLNERESGDSSYPRPLYSRLKMSDNVALQLLIYLPPNTKYIGKYTPKQEKKKEFAQ